MYACVCTLYNLYTCVHWCKARPQETRVSETVMLKNLKSLNLCTYMYEHTPERQSHDDETTNGSDLRQDPRAQLRRPISVTFLCAHCMTAMELPLAMKLRIVPGPMPRYSAKKPPRSRTTACIRDSSGRCPP